MAILGINKGLNASVVLLDDTGKVCLAIQEERLAGTKNFAGFPTLALRLALAETGDCGIEDICLSEKNPFVSPGRDYDLGKFDERFVDVCRRWLASPMAQMRTNLRNGVGTLRRTLLPRRIVRTDAADQVAALGLSAPVSAYDHHRCHAAAAYYGLAVDPEEPYLIFTLDGGGDGRTSAVFLGKQGNIDELAGADAFSLACLYANITHFLGFRPREDEHKLMGLAPYASPKAVAALQTRLQAFTGFAPGQPLVLTSGDRWPKVRNSHGNKDDFISEFYGTLLGERFDVVAGALQRLCEAVAVQWIRAGIAATGVRKILLGGGFFMNVKVNQCLAELPEVDSIACFPSCGDEANAFGAAFLGWRRRHPGQWAGAQFASPFLGPTPASDVEAILRPHVDRLAWQPMVDPATTIATALAEGKLVARCAGRLEFGARALGNRSILAPPNRPDLIARINHSIKQREFWMPFAPAILRERAEELLVLPPALSQSGSPYMMFAFPVRPERRDDLAAAIHPADGTARAQLVDASIAPDLHAILSAYAQKTGIPALLNTSLNRHGEPMADGATEAIRLFLAAPELDLLVLNDLLVQRGWSA